MIRCNFGFPVAKTENRSNHRVAWCCYGVTCNTAQLGTWSQPHHCPEPGDGRGDEPGAGTRAHWSPLIHIYISPHSHSYHADKLLFQVVQARGSGNTLDSRYKSMSWRLWGWRRYTSPVVHPLSPARTLQTLFRPGGGV